MDVYLIVNTVERQRATCLAGITDAIRVGVVLASIREMSAVVTRIANSVGIRVCLISVGNERTIVAFIQ